MCGVCKSDSFVYEDMSLSFLMIDPISSFEVCRFWKDETLQLYLNEGGYSALAYMCSISHTHHTHKLLLCVYCLVYDGETMRQWCKGGGGEEQLPPSANLKEGAKNGYICLL